MAAPTACPKCSSSAVRYSHRRARDGLARLLFYSAFRCQACGHRHYRFSLLGTAAFVGVVLLLASVAGVVYMVSDYYAQSSASLPGDTSLR